MKVICSNCKTIIKEGETIDGLVSHGLCFDFLQELYPTCANEVIERLTESKSE